MLELIFHLRKSLQPLLKTPKVSEMNSLQETTEMRSEKVLVQIFLGYNDAENLAKAVGIPIDSMCFTCSSGNYESLGITPEFKSRKEMKGE